MSLPGARSASTDATVIGAVTLGGYGVDSLRLPTWYKPDQALH